MPEETKIKVKEGIQDLPELPTRKIPKVKIQTYVHINSIIPTEPLWDVIDDDCPPKDCYTKEELYDSIKKDGLIYQLKVDKMGKVLNGNGRYWTARRLHEEGVPGFEYLPVEVETMVGFFPLVRVKPVEGVPTESRDRFLQAINGKNLVIPIPKMQPHTFEDPNHHGDIESAWGMILVLDRLELDTMQLIDVVVTTKNYDGGTEEDAEHTGAIIRDADSKVKVGLPEVQ